VHRRVESGLGLERRNGIVGRSRAYPWLWIGFESLPLCLFKEKESHMSIYEKIDKMNESQLRVAATKMAELLAGDAAQMERWSAELENWGITSTVLPRMFMRADVIRQGMESVGIGI